MKRYIVKITDKAKEKGQLVNMIPQGSPFIDHTGKITIPFNADQKYHFWNGGQQLTDTLMELNAPEDVWAKHTIKPYPGNET